MQEQKQNENTAHPEKKAEDKQNFDKTVKKSKKMSRRNKIIAVIAVIIAVIFGVYLCFDKLFVVENVKFVDAATDKEIKLAYTQDEIFKGLGLKKGMGLYEKDAEDIEKSALFNLSYIDEIEVSREWTSTIEAKVTLAKETYYISIGDSIYILSDKLKVLDGGKNVDVDRFENLIFVDFGKITNCIKGNKIGISEDTENILSELVTVLKAENTLENVRRIDVSDKFGVELGLKAKFEVKLGDYKDFTNKIRMMNRIMEDKSGPGDSGEIDVSKDYGKSGTYKKY